MFYTYEDGENCRNLEKDRGWIRENLGAIIILIGVLECAIGELIAFYLIPIHLSFSSACIVLGIYQLREKTEKLRVLFGIFLLATIIWGVVFCWSILAYLEYVRTYRWEPYCGGPSSYLGWNGAIYIISAGILLLVAWITLAITHLHRVVESKIPVPVSKGYSVQ